MSAISNKLVRDWLQVTKTRGYDLKPLLAASGITWRSYEDSRSRISGQQLARLNSEIRRVLEDQFLGYGHAVMSPALLDRVMMKILAHARNLEEILFEWVSFWNIVQRSTGLTSAVVHNQDLVYRYTFNGVQRPGTYVWILDSIMLKLQLFSWMIGSPIKPKVIGIAEPAPAGVDEDLALLPARVFFDQPENFFAIDKSYLDCPVIRGLEECLDYKRYLPADFFALPGEERCFAVLVERALKDRLRTEFRLPQIESVAEELSISARGLRRRLQSEGKSFQSLKDKVRRDFAMRKLVCAGTTVDEIAADLGFSAGPAFSRAFKAWTKSTPEEYRIRHTRLPA